MNIKLIRSKRRTIALQVREDGSVICRAPLYASKTEIQAFLTAHKCWIDNAETKVKKRLESLSDVKKLTCSEFNELADKALVLFPERVAYYAEKLNVSYGRITIRCQKTLWGSCTSTGNLNFNCLLMLAPSEVIDSVIVHELCHRFEMNHSKKFYNHIYSVFPDYDRCNKWLKDNGDRIMAMKP